MHDIQSEVKHWRRFSTGNATTDSMTYNINIQKGTDSTLIVPDELKSFTGQALISFDTETEKNKNSNDLAASNLVPLYVCDV